MSSRPSGAWRRTAAPFHGPPTPPSASTIAVWRSFADGFHEGAPVDQRAGGQIKVELIDSPGRRVDVIRDPVVRAQSMPFDVETGDHRIHRSIGIRR
jgi:hypothetical protein